MRSRWLVTILCLATMIGLFVSTGCSPERNARRVSTMRSDWERIPDEVDWLFGLDEPSILYEETFPPRGR
jgi:hypothetical protein